MGEPGGTRLVISPRRIHRFAAIAAVSLLMAGCAVGSSVPDDTEPSNQPSAPADAVVDPWESLRVTGDEVEGYPSLSDMAGAADAVVLATVDGVSLGRTLQGDAPEDQVFYAQLDLRVDETLTGTSAEGGTVAMELLVPAATSEAALNVIADLSAGTVGREVLVFLRHKGGNEAGLYRPVNSNGLWTETLRSVLDTPLAESPPGSRSLYQVELERVSDLEDLAAALRSD